MDNMEKILVESEQRSKSNTKRIDKLEKNTDAIQELAISVKLMAQNIESMAVEQKKQGDRLYALEKQPAERWHTLTRTILTGTVSTVVGAIVGVILAGIVGG